MDKIILWGALIIGLVMLLFSLRMVPLKDWLIIFLFTGYISVIAGTIVTEENMISYPVKILENHFVSSLQFEMFTLPIICIYFYHTTYHSTYIGVFLQGLLYTSVLTLLEFLMETYTNVIQYHSWTWMVTFVTVLILIIFVRAFIIFINKKA